MPFDVIIALAVFSLSTTMQAGPNNVLALVSGLNFGFVRSMPLVLGITAGFAVMMTSLGLGLGALFDLYPVLHTVMKVLSLAYLLYIAWRIATASPRMEDGSAAPLSVAEGLKVMLLSPQAWVFAASFVTAFIARDNLLVSVAILVVVCVAARFVGASFWAMGGSLLRPMFKRPAWVRAFNITMALLMVASLKPIVLDLWRQALG